MNDNLIYNSFINKVNCFVLIVREQPVVPVCDGHVFPPELFARSQHPIYFQQSQSRLRFESWPVVVIREKVMNRIDRSMSRRLL